MRNFVVLVKYHGRGRVMNLDGEYVANGLEYVYHVNTAAFWNTNTRIRSVFHVLRPEYMETCDSEGHLEHVEFTI